MPGSDDETVEVGANEEMRLCGLAEDDDEDDLREDAEEMFGRSAQAPIDVSDGQEGGATNDEEGEEDENSAKRSRPSTSVVWLDFKKLLKKSMVRRSGMPLSASIALSNILLSLVVALVTSSGIGINTPGGVKKITCLSLRSILILMVVCVIGSTVLWLHVLNFDCLLG